jgi:hypothetical protein
MVEPYRTGRPLGKNCTFWDVEDAGKLHPDAYSQGMASEGLERHLHETDRRVAVGEEQILRQLSSSTWRRAATTPLWLRSSSRHWRRRKPCASLIGSVLAKN